MDDNNLLDRREFTLQSALAILSAATIHDLRMWWWRR